MNGAAGFGKQLFDRAITHGTPLFFRAFLAAVTSIVLILVATVLPAPYSDIISWAFTMVAVLCAAIIVMYLLGGFEQSTADIPPTDETGEKQLPPKRQEQLEHHPEPAPPGEPLSKSSRSRNR